ncbi:mRNA stability protein mug134 [Penicillium brasilianum]|uniref:mRNA stability protein n=1 Tax=Penicillium brasilianum TaxID=104259 RepID=A0A1S9RY30_PENBI|nr:mRNA stability protein mug134 [Penicillium brasilianum]
MQSKGNGPHAELIAESEKRYLSKYGKLPRGGLLGQKSKERSYFDSGDYALSAADRVTDNGAIHTGKAHPHRESISHPFAPIPSSSNVNKEATDDLYRKRPSLEESPLLQQTNSEDAEPLYKKGQDDSVSHEA